MYSLIIGYGTFCKQYRYIDTETIEKIDVVLLLICQGKVESGPLTSFGRVCHKWFPLAGMLLTGQNLASKTGVWGTLKVISFVKLMLTESFTST